MKTIALIPTYGDRPYLMPMLNWLNEDHGINETYVNRDATPRAPATARKEIVVWFIDLINNVMDENSTELFSINNGAKITKIT